MNLLLSQLRAGKRAIRIKRAKEPLLLTLCGASEETESAATAQDQASVCLDRPRPGAKLQLEPHMVLDSELYEGIVSQTIIEPKVGGQRVHWLEADRFPRRRSVLQVHQDWCHSTPRWCGIRTTSGYT